MERYESLNHTKWECKYHFGMDSEMPEESPLWAASEGSGTSASGVSEAERE
jgi:hypothetical protein